MPISQTHLPGNCSPTEIKRVIRGKKTFDTGLN